MSPLASPTDPVFRSGVTPLEISCKLLPAAGCAVVVEFTEAVTVSDFNVKWTLAGLLFISSLDLMVAFLLRPDLDIVAVIKIPSLWMYVSSCKFTYGIHSRSLSLTAIYSCKSLVETVILLHLAGARFCCVSQSTHAPSPMGDPVKSIHIN